MNTRCSWQHIEVLWSKTISLCKKLNIIYYRITCNPEPQIYKDSTALITHTSTIELLTCLCSDPHVLTSLRAAIRRLVCGTCARDSACSLLRPMNQTSTVCGKCPHASFPFRFCQSKKTQWTEWHLRHLQHWSIFIVCVNTQNVMRDRVGPEECWYSQRLSWLVLKGLWQHLQVISIYWVSHDCSCFIITAGTIRAEMLSLQAQMTLLWVFPHLAFFKYETCQKFGNIMITNVF